MTIHRPLTIRNATRWSTVDLRRLVAAGLAAHGLTHCTVHVAYRRANSGLLGYANIGRRGCRVGAAKTMWLFLERIAPTESKLVQMFPDKCAVIVAQTIDHEIYHLRGLRHRQFPKHVLDNDKADKPPPWWTADMRLAWRAPATPKQKPSLEERREKRLVHAEAMLKKAETRAKRAETIRTKWSRTVRRIERETERSTLTIAVNTSNTLSVDTTTDGATASGLFTVDMPHLAAARRKDMDHA